MRANLYGKSQIVMGDRTSHGGVVLTGSPTNTWHGIPVARKGDAVSCPRCAPFKFVIAEGLENCTDTDAGLPMAVEGHKTTCGAILVAQSAPASAVISANSLIDAHKSPFNEQVQAIEGQSGRSLPGIFYFIERDDGAIFFGETDGDGKCPRIGGDSAQSLKVWFGIAALQKMNEATE